MAKKMSAIVLAAVMSVTLLAGCGSKGTDTAAPADSSAAQTTENQGSTDAGTAGEEGLIPITFSRAQDSLMETDIFARMEGASYEDNLWTDLIAERLGYDVKYLWIDPHHCNTLQNHIFVKNPFLMYPQRRQQIIQQAVCRVIYECP